MIEIEVDAAAPTQAPNQKLITRIIKSVWNRNMIDKDEYFRITKFDNNDSKKWPYSELISEEKTRGKSSIIKFEVTERLFRLILNYINKEGIVTRNMAPEEFLNKGSIPYSFTVHTIRFSLHAIRGNRGGWFILDTMTGLPFIANEFIQYGRKRKSGSRHHQYRRQISQTERNHEDWLRSITPSLDKIYEWSSKKYLPDIKRVSVEFHNERMSSDIEWSDVIKSMHKRKAQVPMVESAPDA